MSTSSRILVVDDDPTNVLVLRRSLEKSGYDVLTANDGFAAVDIAVESQPDLILLDVMMPDRDGLEVCEILKSQESTSGIPVIFVTATSESARIVRAFAAGGSDYVTKPFRAEEILARVSVHVRLRQAEEELRHKNNRLEGLMHQLAESNQQLSLLSRMDPLTKLLNRRTWEESMVIEHERYDRSQSVYSIIMLDVDHFKAYNDTLGHQAGDECLKKVARCISDTCRQVDIAGRYGGEEFVILAPDTNGDAAVKLAERVRKALWNEAMPHPGSRTSNRVTASLGIAESMPGKWEDVLRRADDALYIAKRAGRNMVFGDQRGTAVRASKYFPEPNAEVLQESQTPVSVLVVDDDPTTTANCRTALEKEGYEVRVTADGSSAMTSINDSPPDVIVLDAVMPNMSGLDCVREIKKNPDTQDIPVIMISALDQGDDILAGLEAGADEYLTKPLRTTELTLRVRSMARLYRERSDLLRSYEVRGRHTRILTRLVDFCKAIATTHDAEEVFAETISVISDVTLCQRVSIMLPDSSNQRLTVAKCLGMDEELASTITVPVGQPISGQAFLSEKTIAINSRSSLEASPQMFDAAFFADAPLVSVPLIAARKVLGVINATERADRQPFESQELEYMELIANVAATAAHDILSHEAHSRTSDSIMVALAKLAEHRDNDTGLHLDRITQFCTMLAEDLRTNRVFEDQIDDAFMHDLARAVPLHDIGKVGVPDHILLHPGRLTEEQMEVVRTHTIIGAKTLKLLSEQSPGVTFLSMATDIAQYHHECYDGSGYPTGLKASACPLAARITSIADVYDALTTKRVYKDALSHDKATKIITDGSGKQFDPHIVKAFLRLESQFKQLASDLADVDSDTEAQALQRT